MNDAVSKVLTVWQQASNDLGLGIVAPFDLRLPSGTQINALFLLKKFGARNGMLIVSNFDEVSQYIDEITQAGYGFSVFEERYADETYVRDEFVEVLRDWGWSAPPDLRPAWL
jgi:hypothetical protein